MQKFLFHSSILILMLALSGCGGTKMLKEPEPLVVTHPLATASDLRLAATLDWVIVRDGPGTWAKNADWDEYLIRVQNLSDDPLRVTKIALIDSLGTQIEPVGNRSMLVDRSKETKRRYNNEGLKVKAGAGEAMVTAGTVVAGATGVVVGAYTASYFGAAMGTAVGAAAAGIILLPFAVDGMVRSMNNSEVREQIYSRHTPLPSVLAEAQEQGLDLFFPLAPSPRQIEMTYVYSRGQHTLIIDTQAPLEGLHLEKVDK